MYSTDERALPTKGFCPVEGRRKYGVTPEYLVLDVHSCACGAEAHEHTVRHCPLPIDRPGLGLPLGFLPLARPFLLSKAGGTERPYM